MKFITIALLATSVAAETKPFEFTSTWNLNSDIANITTNSYYNETTHTKVNEMRRKYDDYFSYAFEAKNITMDEGDALIAECSTTQECSDSNEMNQCCVNTVLRHPATGTEDIHYRCMTKSVVDANIDFSLGDFKVNMKCVGSGAAYLAAGASMLSLSAMGLY